MSPTSCLPSLTLFLALALCALTGDSVAQTLYKSVTADGRTVYSDLPPTEGKVQKTMKFDNLPKSPLPANFGKLPALAAKTSDKPAARKGTDKVVMYTATWCGPCRRAKAWMAEQGISYRDWDIDTPEGKAALRETGIGGGIPLLIAGGKQVQGFSPEAYESIIAGIK
jgi:glutaredoxin